MQWWIDLLSPFAAGLAGATAVGLLVRALFPPPPERQGWHRIKPSGMHWIGVVGGSGLVSLMLYVRLFVGSARADAEFQMQILTLLILVFAVCVAVGAATIRSIIRADVRWRGTALDYPGQAGGRASKDLAQVVGMQRRWTGEVLIAFADGDVLKLDGYADGVTGLCSRIIEIDERLAADMPM
jgi:hypothetical protein